MKPCGPVHVASRQDWLNLRPISRTLLRSADADSTLSVVVDSKRAVDLPLSRCSVYSLAALMPGVFARRPASDINREGLQSIGMYAVRAENAKTDILVQCSRRTLTFESSYYHSRSRQTSSIHQRGAEAFPALSRGVS